MIDGHVLRYSGYEVYEAADGEEGVVKALETKPSMILMRLDDAKAGRMGGESRLEPAPGNSRYPGATRDRDWKRRGRWRAEEARLHRDAPEAHRAEATGSWDSTGRRRAYGT